MKTTELKFLTNPVVSFDTTTDSHGVIQWKGTDLVMDVHCDCGHTSQINGDGVYFLKCPACNTVYELNAYVQLIKRHDIAARPDTDIKIPVL